MCERGLARSMASDSRVTTPFTEMLAEYRACPRGLVAGEAYGASLLEDPRLASLFLLSVAQFSRYSNVDEPFHEGPLAPPFTPEHCTEPIRRTVHVACRLAGADRRTIECVGGESLELLYVDRELDVMRTSTTQLLDDRSQSKRALVLDLLLARSDGTPLLTELKIKKDTHPVCALLQVLAAAAHLVTPAQRKRLETCYSEKVALPGAAPYLDLAVLLVDKPRRGKSVDLLETAKLLARELLKVASVGSLIGQIYFLVPDDLEQRSIVLRCV
jgi:hypothetical protein